MKRALILRLASCDLRVLISVGLLCAITSSAQATTITVTNTNDSGSGSLRQALIDANKGDTIEFAVTGTIMLTSGELLVNKSITISGPGAFNLTIDGSSKSRVLHVGSDTTLAVSGLRFMHGKSPGSGDDGSAIYNGQATLVLSDSVISDNAGMGGGVANDHGTLTMSNCTISNNYTGDRGGGILNDEGTLNLNHCFVTGNQSYAGAGIYNIGGSSILTVMGSIITGNFNNGGGEGGGIFNWDGMVTLVDSTVSKNFADLLFDPNGGGVMNGGAMEIVDSTIIGNAAGDTGGGILNSGTLTLMNSTVSGNHAGTNLPTSGSGGGIYNSGALQVINSTISGNEVNGKEPSGWGAGINNAGTLQIRNSTFSDNHAGVHGGNLYGGAFEIGNTILNAGTPENLFGVDGVISAGYNISSDNAGGYLNGPGDQINTDPLLGPLQDNGGPTFTHELLVGSPAIDAGDPGFTPPPWYDQRGPDFYRLRNGRIDIGSFEVQEGPAVTPTPSPTSTPTPTPSASPTPTATPTSTPTQTPSATPSVAPKVTPRPRPTPHPRPTPP